MTYKERLHQDYPESIAFGNINKCPCHYGYEPDSDCCPEGVRSTCSVCWDREMPEQKWAETMSQDQVLRYIYLVDRKVYILLHSGVDWKPEYGPEMQEIDAELVRLRELVDATLKNAPEAATSQGK